MTNYVDLLKKLAGYRAQSQRGKRLASTALVLSIASVLSFALFATAPDPVPEERVEKAWPISSFSIEPRDIAPVFRAYGKIESTNIALIQSDSREIIQKVNVREGQLVTTGEILIELDNTELGLRLGESAAELALQEADLRSIEVDYALAKETQSHYRGVYKVSQQKLARHLELFEGRMISQSLLDEAVQLASQSTIAYQDHKRQMANFPNKILKQQARVVKAKSSLQQANINLEKANIRAPFNGPVLSVMASLGSHAIPGEALLVVAQTAGFEVRVPVPNTYVGRLREALENNEPILAKLTELQAPADMVLSRLSSNVKVGQSGIDAFFSIKTDALDYLPEIGRLVNVAIVLPPEKNVVDLPLQSLYENDRIYEVIDSRLNSIEVTRIGEFLSAQGDYRILVRWEDQEVGQEIISTQLPKPITGLLIKRASSQDNPQG